MTIVTLRGILKNAAVLTAMKVLAPTVSLALILGISRLLGTDGMGRYTVILAFHTFFTAVAPFGLNAFLMREGARDPGRFSRLVVHALVFGGVSAAALTPIMALSGRMLGYDEITQSALAVMALAILPTTLQTYLDAVFISRGRSEFIAVAAVLDLLVRVGGGLWLLFQGYGIVAVALTFLGGQAAAAVVSVLLLQRAGVVLSWSFDRALFQHLARTGTTFLAISVFATIYWRIDVVMLSLLGTIDEVGLYGAAYRMMEIAKILPQNICLAIYPAVSEAAAADPARLSRLGRNVLRYLLMVTLPVAVGTTILAEPILKLTVGDGFLAATSVLTVLIWAIIPFGLARYYAFVLVAAERQRIDLWLNVWMSLVNIALNLMLIPRFGALGAAAATTVSIVVLLAAQTLYLRRQLPDHLAPAPEIRKLVLSTVLMGIVIWWIRDLPVTPVIGLGAAVYLTMLFATRFFSRQELQALWVGRPSEASGAVD
jgi:O-antigen/teichoic acid export membrane protein